MSELRYINPEIAAHNVANAFVEKHLACLDADEVFNPDDTMYEKTVATAAQIYACAYDTAFNVISKENSEIDEK